MGCCYCYCSGLSAFFSDGIVYLLFLCEIQKHKYVNAAMSGLLPMSVALIGAAALLLMNKDNFIDYKSILIFVAAFFLTWKYKVHPILMILLAGVMGFILY